ncbi:hypothetical protein FOL47_009631 [Perkinsus chesapeaki]|uniref:Uncharacterized protein n=1 Tax=Perkinsus chesapeaki TaxID=330153 RepID=A0A7J6L782_PERCH|nr:hypothetical protein FOL47_009631 [Perkinsus chesapeaki]
MTIGISTSLESNLVGQDVLVLCDTGEDEPSPFSSFIHGRVTSLRIAPNMRDTEAVVLVHGGGPDNIIIRPANKLYPLQASSLALEHSDVSYCIREAGLPLHRGTITATVQARLPRICTADVPPKMRVSLVSARSPLGEVLGDQSGTIGHRHKVEQVDLESSAHVVWIIGEGSLASTWNAVAKASSGEPDAKLRAACLLCSLIATDCEGRCHAALFLNGSYSLEAFPLSSGPNEAYSSVLLAHAYSYLIEFVQQSSQQQHPTNSAFMETLSFLAETRLSWPIIQDAKKLRDLGKSLACLSIDLDGFMRICCALMLLVQSSSLALSPCLRPDILICSLLGIPGPLDKNDRSIDFVYVIQRGLLCWAAGLEVSKENGDGTIILGTPRGRQDSYGNYGQLLVTREVLRIARCNRAAGYIDELFRKACEYLRLPSNGETRVLKMLKNSRVRLVRDVCEAAMDEQVGRDWLDAAKESVDSVRESGIGAHIIIVLREDRDPLKLAEQLWLFSTITATRVNPMMKPFHVDLDEARDRLALQSTDESAILEEISTRIGVPPGGIDIRKGALRIGVGVIGHLLKHEAALKKPKLKQDRCERALKSCMSRIYTKKAIEKVVIIQSLYRSWYERKESLERVPKAFDCLLGTFCLLRRVSEFSDRHAAIVRIQRVWRQKRTRMKYAGYIRQLRQIQAAVVIQSFYRKYAAMRIVEELRSGQARKYAVEVIQSCMKRHLARLLLLNKAYELRAERAAIVIQAYWRGLVIRRWWGKVRGGLPWLALIIKAKLMAMQEAQLSASSETSARELNWRKWKDSFVLMNGP